ncbi:hypothetical protein GCM10008942_36270 [Rhizomicrobium electricum]|uniref:Uncharacterized protein n=2 Tax=Rhizomicrobium electricum TaxID=480070 RepID=A0ABN1F7B7_9PROT
MLSGMPAYGSNLKGYSISPRVKMTDNERIVGLTITLTNGTFSSFNGIPEGWYFRIDNSTHAQEALSGEVSVGAGALYRKELQNVWICARASDRANAKFAVSGELWITTDFVKTRKLKLTQVDFASRPCAALPHE